VPNRKADTPQLPYDVVKRAATLLTLAREAEQRGSHGEATRLRGVARRLLTPRRDGGCPFAPGTTSRRGVRQVQAFAEDALMRFIGHF
jgi:hypothetical protein